MACFARGKQVAWGSGDRTQLGLVTNITTSVLGVTVQVQTQAVQAGAEVITTINRFTHHRVTKKISKPPLRLATAADRGAVTKAARVARLAQEEEDKKADDAKIAAGKRAAEMATPLEESDRKAAEKEGAAAAAAAAAAAKAAARKAPPAHAQAPPARTAPPSLPKEGAGKEAEQRHGRLVCRDAPLTSLNGEWAWLNYDDEASPRFAHSHDPKLVLASDGVAWRITREAASGGEVIAEAASTALHPGTVEVGSWKVFDRGKELPKSAELEMLCDGPNTEEQPFLMEELGRDFFLRVHLTRKVVWFVCPATGDIYHSAAKPGGEGGRSKPGKRYCHLCNKCFSANNFQSQHLVNLHPELVAKKPPKEKKEKKLAGLEKVEAGDKEDEEAEGGSPGAAAASADGSVVRA